MVLLLFVIVCMYLSRPLYDPDFYWHLKTGEWIWQHKSLPHFDPFGVPPLSEISPRTEFISTSYWLLQLIMYGFYSMFGMSGIVLFRWIVAGISLLICGRWANLRNSNALVVVAIGTIQILEYYFIERPQFISFICFGALLVLLFRFFEERTQRTLGSLLIPLSLLMTIWANMHGGFLIGQAIIVYCVVTEGIKFLHPSFSPLAKQHYRIVLISSIAALAASFINPNAVNLIKYLPIIFDAGHYANKNILEELSLLRYYQETRDGTAVTYAVTIVVTLVALLVSKHRKNITWVGILAGTAFMGFQHMRLMPFFLVSAMIFMTRYVGTELFAIKGRVLLMAMLVFTTVYSVRDEFPRIVSTLKSGWVPADHFPVEAADFISANHIKGSVYTTMEWGGYMIWRVGTEKKIFHDSRVFNLQRAWEYNNSQIITTNQRPYWKGLFNMYSIGIVIVPQYEASGEPNLLSQSIAADSEWKAIFSNGNEVVFVKNDLP